MIPQYLKKFREAHPEVKVNFSLGKTADIMQRIKVGSIDFGIVPEECSLSAFDVREVYRGKFKLYATPNIKCSIVKKKLGIILAEQDCKETRSPKKGPI